MSKEFFEQAGQAINNFFEGVQDFFENLNPQKAAKEANAKARHGNLDANFRKCCPEPNWMVYAWEEHAKNVEEGKNDPNIPKYHGASAYTKDGDDGDAWCGSFVAWCLLQSGYTRDDITNVPERALTWGRDSFSDNGWWPRGKKIDEPIYGCIAVKGRDRGGHVTFVVGKDKNNSDILKCLGGNQGNKLQVSNYSKSVFHSFMVPSDYVHDCCELNSYDGASEDAGDES